MKQITDNDLVLLYYGEHDDPVLATRVAESEELSRRFEALSDELSRMDAITPPERDDDYGSEVWHRISPRLDEATKPSSSWWNRFSALKAPRFGLAGALSIAVVFTVAFFLGREGVQTGNDAQPGAETGLATTLKQLDTSQLLSNSVSDHLEQVNVTFTQFANSSELSTDMAEHATDMLLTNRLYRQAALASGDRKLASFLGELEPLLIELAHEAYKNSATTRDRMQKEVRDSLLFRVRIMNQQLNESQIST